MPRREGTDEKAQIAFARHVKETPFFRPSLWGFIEPETEEMPINPRIITVFVTRYPEKRIDP